MRICAVGLGLCVAVLASFVARAAVAAADFRLERLSPRETYLAPGQSAGYTLRIRNVGNATGVAHVGDDTHSSYPWMDDFTSYSLVQSDRPECGAFDHEYTGFFNDYRIVFEAGPINAGEYVDCTMTVGRDTDSRHDMAMSWGVRIGTSEPPVYEHATENALFGTLTEVSIETRSFGFFIDDTGFAHATTELRLRNRGSVPVDPQIAGACEDFFFRPFITDGSEPGGCGSDQYSPECFYGGYGFLVPEIPAGGTYSCTIRMTSIEPYESPLSYAIMVGTRQSGAGYTFIDIDPQNNQAALRLEPDANEVEATPVPSVARLGLVLFGSAIILIIYVKSGLSSGRSRTGSRSDDME